MSHLSRDYAQKTSPLRKQKGPSPPICPRTGPTSTKGSLSAEDTRAYLAKIKTVNSRTYVPSRVATSRIQPVNIKTKHSLIRPDRKRPGQQTRAPRSVHLLTETTRVPRRISLCPGTPPLIPRLIRTRPVTHHHQRQTTPAKPGTHKSSSWISLQARTHLSATPQQAHRKHAFSLSTS